MEIIDGVSVQAGIESTTEKIRLGTHPHVLLIVTDASSLNADTDTALKNEMENLGYEVVIGDPADVNGKLELSFDFIVVSGSVASESNLSNLREADCPIITHSAEVAISTNILSLGATAGTVATQTIIEIIDNTPVWLITQSTANLTVTTSATLETMASVSGSTINLAEKASGTGDDITMAVLRQGTEDGSGVIHNFDRYFIGVANFTLANATFKAIMRDLWEHAIHEVRFSEVVVTPKRVYQEVIPDTGFNLASIDTATASPPSADAANSVIAIDKKTNRTFVLRSLFVNSTGLGGDGAILTYKLWIDVAGTATEVNSKDINATGYDDLVALFGISEVHADSIHITVTTAASTGACSGIYRYAEARK